MSGRARCRVGGSELSQPKKPIISTRFGGVYKAATLLDGKNPNAPASRHSCAAVPGSGPKRADRVGSATVRLCRFLLQILLPLPARGEAVHHGAVDEGALGSRDVFAPAGPGLLRRRLQRAAVAEGDAPRQAADAVDGVEVGGCLFVRLAA